ncbi:MAG: GNAT family N-acetyltransferase [Christensenellales bacterium]
MDFMLRPWRITDVQPVARYANNQKIANNLRDAFPNPYTEKDAQNFIEKCIVADASRQICYAIEVCGEAAGSIGLIVQNDIYRKTAELGYWLAEAYWNQGIMQHAIMQMCQEAFTRLDIVRIFAEPFSHNTASKKALEHAGFTLEGILKQSIYKNGQIGDSCIYALYKPLA